MRLAEGCSRCPALAANRRCIVHSYGAPDARILFVGEAPGYKGADLTGVPFTGTGQGCGSSKCSSRWGYQPRPIRASSTLASPAL